MISILMLPFFQVQFGRANKMGRGRERGRKATSSIAQFVVIEVVAADVEKSQREQFKLDAARYLHIPRHVAIFCRTTNRKGPNRIGISITVAIIVF